MKLGLLVFTLFSLMLISQANANIHQIKFAVNSPGSAPYIYYDNISGKFQGVVVDFFTNLEKSGRFKLEYKLVLSPLSDALFIFSNKKRDKLTIIH
jgi:hypothetical protein